MWPLSATPMRTLVVASRAGLGIEFALLERLRQPGGEASGSVRAVNARLGKVQGVSLARGAIATVQLRIPKTLILHPLNPSTSPSLAPTGGKSDEISIEPRSAGDTMTSDILASEKALGSATLTGTGARSIDAKSLVESVVRSWPTESPSSTHSFGPLAQLVEQETLNLLVVGSIPTRPTI